MSENILNALMQLFAIIANPESNKRNRRPEVKQFLGSLLNKELVRQYLIVFDNYYREYQKKSKSSRRRSRVSSSSVKIIRICSMLNRELSIRQKVVVLINLLEFISADEQAGAQEYEFVDIVSSLFNISSEEYQNLLAFILCEQNELAGIPEILLIQKDKPQNPAVKYLQAETLEAPIAVYFNKSAKMYIFIYYGTKELYLNGQLIVRNRASVLSPGSTIRDTRRNPIYFNDIAGAFREEDESEKLIFNAQNITYKFPGGKTALYKFNFAETNGNLVGIMGASGSGKSTLLNILNGNNNPQTGDVLINGYSVFRDKKKLEGIIGYVSQNDLLIEDLTVFQNLYYNAQLSFGGKNKAQILRKVNETLLSLGLYEIRNMKVGSPLNKKISGGQRKRLNIALELIREPSVLFLDEPTSGLSSRDSENILELLKGISLRGRLIFVVIHQPSSDIFKMFDRLLILDQGGYLVYDGDPVEAPVYFKSQMNQADWNENECPACGNVNPEQIFDILEAQILDEYGKFTNQRRKKPSEWYIAFQKNSTPRNDQLREEMQSDDKHLPKITFKRPRRCKQFQTFARRDILSKLANKQYVLINLIEAPLLAFIMAGILRYYDISVLNNLGYSYSQNENIPVYIFVSVIIALFIGLTTSANEIVKDRLILQRESFLNLSRRAYLFSKISILFSLSAYQALTFVLVGNYMLEIRSMYWEYWLILFSVWSFAVMLGLNISDAFKTNISIYIIIPFLIIPQIVLSGILVQFDKLNPALTGPGHIPWFGEIMTARWAYEALAVEQFVNNEYKKPLFPYERIKYDANFNKDMIISELKGKIADLRKNTDRHEHPSESKKALQLLRNELNKFKQKEPEVKTGWNPKHLFLEKISENDLQAVESYLDRLKILYINRYKTADALQDDYVRAQTATDSLNKAYIRLKQNYDNESLEKIINNSNQFRKIMEYDGHLYQCTNLVYSLPTTILKAHFYAPKKKFINGKYYSTYTINLIVIWIYTLILYFTLYFGILRKSAEYIEKIRLRLIR
ncbi:MAG: ABC transporter [Bacteroidia bacterium]|nr:MAG: ABC transporter [Bacteroidia bacterium]